MYDPQDDIKSAKAWLQTANMAKNNIGNDGYKAWVHAASKSIKHNNPSVADGNVEYPDNDKITELVANIMYNNDSDRVNAKATEFGIQLDNDLNKPGQGVIEAALNDNFQKSVYKEAKQQEISNNIHRNYIAQRRNGAIFSAQHFSQLDFAINDDFDIEDAEQQALNDFHDMLGNFSSMVRSIPQNVNNWLNGNQNSIEPQQGNFAQRERQRQGENHQNNRTFDL